MSETEQQKDQTAENPEQLTEPASSDLVEAKKPVTKQTSVAKSAGVVSIAVMGSRVLGLVREMIFAAVFGAGFLADAFQAAFKISNTLRDLFAIGSFEMPIPVVVLCFPIFVFHSRGVVGVICLKIIYRKNSWH